MTKTYQAEHFTGAQLDDFMKKVNSGELAGRGLEIDDTGTLHSTVQGYSKLVYTYTHTGNIEIHPTDLDLETGLFTAPAHGIENYMTIYATMNDGYNIGQPYRYLPVGLLLGTTSNTSTGQTYVLRYVDEDHFKIATSGVADPLTFTAPESGEMDLGKFHFEVIDLTVGQQYVIEGLDAQECLMVVKGKIVNYFRHIHPTNRVDFGSYTGGQAYDAAFNVDITGACYFGRPGYNFSYGVFEFKMMGGCHAYQVNNVNYVTYPAGGGKPEIRNIRQYYHWLLSSDKIEGLFLNSEQGHFLNGSTVEVYVK